MNVNEYGKTASGNQKPLGMVAPASSLVLSPKGDPIVSLDDALVEMVMRESVVWESRVKAQDEYGAFSTGRIGGCW